MKPRTRHILQSGTTSRVSPGWLSIVTGALWAGCVLNPGALQMYDGPSLPKEQVGIVRSGCVSEGGLTIMVVSIDGRAVANACSDFALLPGEHRFELTAERRAPSLGAPMMGSGGVLGAPPSGISGEPRQGSRVLWQSPSPLVIVCQLRAGQEVVIVGSGGMGP